MVVINKAVGEEGLRSILQLIAGRASVDEAFLLNQLGEGLKLNTETGKIDVDFSQIQQSIGTFYIDERGHLMWKNEDPNAEDIDWGMFFIDERGHLIWKRDTGGPDDEKYVVVNASNTVEFAKDEDIANILNNIDLG